MGSCLDFLWVGGLSEKLSLDLSLQSLIPLQKKLSCSQKSAAAQIMNFTWFPAAAQTTDISQVSGLIRFLSLSVLVEGKHTQRNAQHSNFLTETTSVQWETEFIFNHLAAGYQGLKKKLKGLSFDEGSFKLNFPKV